jgi:3'-phosphoadenosine 5'-phosphosulfate sulfotransferase (PAPS reductase)/FAD synthetase
MGEAVSHDPFKIDGPTCISFSGGRTSAYMLWRVLQSNGGLPAETVVCFANTGKEEEATLRFVQDCAERWDVPINWVEYTGKDDATHRLASFQTASRDGEPFEALILRRRFLPNPVSRFCTSELKIRTMHRHLRSLGWTEWDQFVGIRADEQRRVSKIRARGTSTETKDDTMCMPLADAGVSVQDVGAFWRAQPFDLELPTVNGRTLEGNCDLCFLKPPAQRLALIAAKPERATWWIRMESFAESISEKPAGAKFNRYGEPSYTQLAAFARDQRDMFDPNEEAIACFCGD